MKKNAIVKVVGTEVKLVGHIYGDSSISVDITHGSISFWFPKGIKVGSVSERTSCIGLDQVEVVRVLDSGEVLPV